MGGHCGRRTLVSEQPQQADSEANVAGVVEQSGSVVCENETRHLVQDDKGAGVVQKLSR